MGTVPDIIINGLGIVVILAAILFLYTLVRFVWDSLPCSTSHSRPVKVNPAEIREKHLRLRNGGMR